MKTRRGWVVLASDASHYYANLEQDRPFPIVVDMQEMLDGFALVRSLASSGEPHHPGPRPAGPGALSAEPAGPAPHREGGRAADRLTGRAHAPTPLPAARLANLAGRFSSMDERRARSCGPQPPLRGSPVARPGRSAPGRSRAGDVRDGANPTSGRAGCPSCGRAPARDARASSPPRPRRPGARSRPGCARARRGPSGFAQDGRTGPGSGQGSRRGRCRTRPRRITSTKRRFPVAVASAR